LLGNKYNVYHHAKSGETVVRAMSYSLPRELHSHIDVVAPTTFFGTMRSMRATSFLQPDLKPVDPSDKQLGSHGTVPGSCTSTITPACLRGLYNTVNYVPSATSKNSIGIAGYLNRSSPRPFFLSILRLIIVV
jgi:tripeptidyl-peptidase-1